MITLKPQLSTFIALMLGGLFFLWMGGGIWVGVGEFHVIYLVLIFIGCLFSYLGVHILMNRGKHLIQISPMGIKFTNYDLVRFIEIHQIKKIESVENFRGRKISIELVDGEPIEFDPRHHCSIKAFIKHCKKANLPCA